MPASAPSPAEWLPYMDGSAAMLAVFLVALAGTCAYIGMKIRNPISVSRPGRVVSGFLIAIWALAIYTFFVALYVYALQLRQVYPHFARPPKVRVGTLVDAAATFLVILYLTRRYGWKIAVGSAFAGHCRRPDALRASIRPDRHADDLPCHTSRPDTVSRALFPSVVHRRTFDDLAAGIAAFHADHRESTCTHLRPCLRCLRFGQPSVSAFPRHGCPGRSTSSRSCYASSQRSYCSSGEKRRQT